MNLGRPKEPYTRWGADSQCYGAILRRRRAAHCKVQEPPVVSCATRAQQLLRRATVWLQTWAEKCGGGCCAPFRGTGLGSHLIQCCLAEAYLRTMWHLDPSNHLAIIHQRYTDRQTGQIEQRSHSIGRTVTCNGRPKRLNRSRWRLGYVLRWAQESMH